MAQTKKRAKGIEPRTRIREIMDKDGVTRYWLAKETGMSYVTVNAYYYNKSLPSLEALYRIAEALKVSAKDLLV